MSIEIITVPDIGTDSAEVVELLVKVGDMIEKDQSIAVLESDKASVEMPSPKAGQVVALALNLGDQVSEGSKAIEIDVSANQIDDQSADTEEESGVSDSASDAATVVDENADNDSSEAPVSEPPQNEATTTAEKLCLVPDIGAEAAEIIEVSVKEGDSVMEGDSIVVAESDKASLEIPAEFDGVVIALHVGQGDKVSQGAELVTLSGQVQTKDENTDVNANTEDEIIIDDVEPPILENVVETDELPTAKTYPLPDVGSDSAEVIEMSVSVGDEILEGDSVCVIETDKASVEVPAPASGTVETLFVAAGDTVSQGQDFICILSKGSAASGSAGEKKTTEPTPATEKASEPSVPKSSEQKKEQSVAVTKPASVVSRSSAEVYAGPSVRKHARELGVDLIDVKGTGERGRIIKDDVNAYVKKRLKGGSGSTSGVGIPEIPPVVWEDFGEVSTEPMTRIHKVTAANMLRNWLNVPHVTQFNDADVTELEKYRGYLKPEATSRGVKMTPVAFIMKAVAVALQEHPKMNASLHHNGEDVVYRKFVHVGLAVDTPAGLMVPVIRDADQKDIWQLAADIGEMAEKAKTGKLSLKEMQGASFTVSSLGAIGGTGFTPIVSAPQVGILGVASTSIKPVWDGSAFQPRKIMPLSLSYDHRAVNGSDGGRFMATLVEVLEDINRLWDKMG